MATRYMEKRRILQRALMAVLHGMEKRDHQLPTNPDAEIDEGTAQGRTRATQK